MVMVMMMMMMILIFKTSGFLSPRPETEKLGFAGVLLRLTFAEVYTCFDLSILSSFSRKLVDASSNMLCGG